MRRRVEVPFKADGKKVKIPVYLVDSQEVAPDGADLDVFVPVRRFVDAVIDLEKYEFEGEVVPHGLKPGTGMQDWRDHCDGQGHCITWRDVAKLGWAIRRKDGKPNELGLQIVFFSQCVMRGFLHRLVQIEGNIHDELASGSTVFWKPYVDCLRREVESFKHVDQNDSGLPEFVKEEVTGMWRRIKREVSGQNKENLKNALSNRTAKVIQLSG